MTNKIIQTELKDLKPFQRLAFQNIALVGDAGHATTPNMGQGAAQAMESGYMIAELLSKFSPEDAFIRYERLRKKRLKFIVGQSWRIGQYAHISNPVSREFLYFLMKNSPRYMEQKILNSVFSPNIDI